MAEVLNEATVRAAWTAMGEKNGVRVDLLGGR